MCGILAALGITGDPETNRRQILKLSKLLRHRGPDQNALYQAPDGRAFIAFERLMIVDPTDSGRYVGHHHSLFSQRFDLKLPLYWFVVT